MMKRWIAVKISEVNSKVERLFNYGISNVYIYNVNETGWACIGEERGVYRVLLGKPEGKRPLGRPGRRWVDNIRMDLWDVGIWTGLGWPRIETGGGRL